jgi:hypothetical protein
MSVQLRWEQCCASHGCTRPARFGELCTKCFLEATPAQRDVELHADPRAHDPSQAAPVRPDGHDRVVDEEGVAWLSDLWAA